VDVRLWTVALLALAGVGPILIAQIGPVFVGQEIPLIHHATPRIIPDIEFKDGQGQTKSLSDFKGRVVLLNVWATWCPPCREEMPSLDRLQAKHGSAEFEVVAISIDRAGVNGVERFFKSFNLRHLTLYIDESVTTMQKLGIVGVPTTLLIDREGHEVWRYAGPVEWDQTKMVQFIRNAIAAQER